MQSGFFNSLVTGTDSDGSPVYDRVYDADFLTRLIGSVVPNGVTAGSFIPLRSSEDMTVSVSSGGCFINGCFGFNVFSYDFIIPTSSNARTDIIVLRLDTAQRSISLQLKQGTTELTRTSTVYELAIASVFVEANTDSLGENAVTDLRFDSDKCGVVSFGGSTGATDLGVYSLPQNSSDIQQNRLVVRGSNGIIAGTVQNSEKLAGRSVYVQQSQPASPATGDLWFW